MIFGPQLLHELLASASSGGAGTAVSYDSFSIPSGTSNLGWYVIEFNSKLYSYGIQDTEVHESSDGGATWSFKYHMQYNLNNAIIPVVESNRVLYIDGGSNNNVLKSWDGSSSTATTINTGLTFTQIKYFGKVDSYYYIADYAGPLYRTSDTTLTSGWSQISGITAAEEIVKSGGTIVTVDPAWGMFRTTDDWSTVSTITTSGGNYSVATDGNGNWITGAQFRSRYSTDDGITWSVNYNMHSAESGTGNNTNSFILNNGIKFIGDKFFWINTWDDELVSNANPFQDHISTNTNSRVYQFPGEANYISLVGNDKMFVSGQDANGTWGLYKFNITGLPQVIPDGTAATLPYSITTQSSSNGPSANVRFYIDTTTSGGGLIYFANNSTTPLEAKRLWEAALYNTSVSSQLTSTIYFKDINGNDVSSPNVGDFCYGSNNDPLDPRLYPIARPFDMGANQDYYWFAARYDGTSVYSPSLQPTDDCYWIKMDTTTAEIVALYDNNSITKNILVNVNQKGTPTSASIYGEVFRPVNPGGSSNNNGHTSYTDALNQSPADARTWGDRNYGLYSVSGTGLPAVGDRIYDELSSNSIPDSDFHEYAVKTWEFFTSGNWIAYNRDWNSTTTQYAIQLTIVSSGSSRAFKEITEIRDSNGNSITSVPDVTPVPSQTVTPSSSSIFAFKTSEPNNSNNYIEFQSNEHTTPAESKRLWNLGDGIVDASLQLWPDTSTLAAGTVLYYGSTLTTLAFDPSAWVTHTRNSYVYYIINSNATNQYNVNPASVDYWVKVDTATSTIVHIYADADVTANTLKDVTSNVGSGGTVGPNGAIFFGDGNTAYSTYTGALNANISNQDYAYQIYIDSEDKYPKVGDRPYITTTSKSSNIWGGGAGQWFPFLVEGTTSSGSVSYAIQMGYASWDGSNISTTSPGSSNNVFITEIRDSNGNSVTEIQDPPPLITASGSAQLGYLVQNGTNGFLISTSSNHQTPTEAKRLYATSDSPDMAGSLYAYFSGTFQVGTVLYSSPSQATTFAGAYTAGYMTNDYAHFAVKADGGSWAGSDPSNFYWVTIQKSNSTVTAITENINVSANVLKDVGTNTSGLPNSSYGGFVLNNSAYNSYTTALAASLTSSQNLSVFYDGPGSYPKTHDRIYTASTGQQSFAATIPGGIGWHPFTTTGSSIDYAVQIGYASSSGTNSNTLPRANSTDLWISEIRDSNGNIVTEITTPVPMGWFANASDEYSAFSTRSDACSGGFANSTSIRVHFKTTTGTIAYPTTTQDIIDGSLSGSGTTLDMYNDSNGSPSTKFRGGALYVGLVYKPISNQNTSTQPQLTLTALGSSADVPSYSSEGMYNSVQSCP